jgi:hypothetical protein
MKVDNLPLEKVLTQLEILEYIELNKREGLTDGDRILQSSSKSENGVCARVAPGCQIPCETNSKVRRFVSMNCSMQRRRWLLARTSCWLRLAILRRHLR